MPKERGNPFNCFSGLVEFECFCDSISLYSMDTKLIRQHMHQKTNCLSIYFIVFDLGKILDIHGYVFYFAAQQKH